MLNYIALVKDSPKAETNSGLLHILAVRMPVGLQSHSVPLRRIGL